MPGAIAKISRPSLRNVLERGEPLGRLESALQSPVVWVTGPPGSGKTTLVSDFIRSRNLPCLWYQVDERDKDPGTFFHYMVRAAQNSRPGMAEELPDFLPEYLPGLMVFATHFFETLFQSLGENSLLVFDNYQMVGPDAPLHTLMKRGGSLLPRGMNIIMISRESPPMALTGLLADNTMGVLPWDDLRLSLDETRDILKLRGRFPHTEEEAQQLHDLTKGWVSGVTLWLQAAAFSSTVSFTDVHETPEEIFDYFAGEIFAQTSPGMKHFLMATSFLPKMNAAMADAIADTANAREILHRLAGQQYFILGYGHGDRFYAYHQLFGSFLQYQARQAFDAQKFDQYRRRAAALLVDNGEVEEAARLLMESKAFDDLAQLIVSRAWDLIGQGRHAVVVEWLYVLPLAFLRENPWLMFWQGMAHAVMDPERSCRYFEIAFHWFSRQGDMTGKLLAWSGIVDATALRFDRFKGFDKWIRVFDEIKEGVHTIGDGQIRSRVAASALKALILRQPHHPDVEKWAKEALMEEGGGEMLNMRSWVYVRLQFFYFTMKTDVARVREMAVQLAKNAADPPSTSPMAEINVLYTQVVDLEVRGHMEQGLAVISTYKAFAEKSGIHLFDAFFSVHEVCIYLESGQFQRAMALVKEMQLVEGEMNLWAKSLFYCQKARAGIVTHAHADILADIDRGLELAREVGCSFTEVICMIQKVHVCLVLGHPDRAQAVLDRYFTFIKDRESELDRYMGLLTQAWLHLEAGREADGLAALAKGLALGRRYQLLFNFADQPLSTQALCMKALAEDMEVPHVQWWIQKRQFRPDPPPVHLPNWPWPVRIHSFGSFEIELDNTRLHPSGKAPRKILKLLKAIIAYPNDKVPAVWLMDHLWPDADGDRAMESLKVSIKRLRKMLGHSHTVQWERGTIAMNPERVWVDLAAFESINRGLGRHGSNAPFSMGDRIHSALDLIKGPFLEGDDSLPIFIARRAELEIMIANLFQLAFMRGISHEKMSRLIPSLNRVVTTPRLSRAMQQQWVDWVAKKTD